MRTPRRWRLDLESEVSVLPAPSKSTADDYAGLVMQGGDYAVGAVCDGVTGREGQGGVAAARTLEALRALDWPEPAGVRVVEQRLVEAIRRANAALLRGERSRRRSGSPPSTTCTLGAVYVSEGRCYATAAWVGDSPAAIVTPYDVRTITPPDQDHAASAPAALGVREDLTVEVRTVEVAAGQALLLHSDGFGLDGGECLRVYKNTIGDRHGWAKFLEQAMQRSQPSNDDKSALVIGIVGEPEEVSAPADPAISLEPERATAPARRAPAGLQLAVVVPLVLVIGALSWLLGRSGLTGLPAAATRAGVTALGEQFAVGEHGAVVPLSALADSRGKALHSGAWPVYTLEVGEKGPRVIPAGQLSLTARDGKSKQEVTLGVAAPTGYRIYVDGMRASPPVSIDASPAGTHRIEMYADKPKLKWGCEVVTKAEGVFVKPLKARAEPR